MNWYYVEQGKQAGPVEDTQLEEMRRDGVIQGDTLVWREGMTDWVPYDRAKAPATPPSRPAARAASAAPIMGDPVEAVCTECGRIFPKDQMIRYGESHVCQNCKPVFMQKLSEGARINVGRLNYAGFWIRLVAKFLDGLVLSVVVAIPIFILIFVFAASATHNRANFSVLPDDYGAQAYASSSPSGADVLINLMMMASQVVVYGLGIIYSTFFNGRYGATPGKMMCGLRVVDAEGNQISFGRAFGRGCAELLSNICSIGYIIAAFDSQKRSLHDHICNTRVVFK